MKRRFPLWASVCTLLGVVVLCALGFWQVQRLAWKEDLLSRLDAAYARDAADYPLNSVDWRARDLPFTRGYIEGSYIRDADILIMPRTLEGRPGYHVLAPFEMTGSAGSVLVNRGWIPLDQNTPEARDKRTPEGEVIVTGMVRPVLQANMFVPQNEPRKEAWYRVDPDQIAQARGIENLHPYMFYAETESPSAASSFAPVPVSAKIRPPNNHRQYAVFWFTMAGLLLVMYGLRFGRLRYGVDSDVD